MERFIPGAVCLIFLEEGIGIKIRVFEVLDVSSERSRVLKSIIW